MNWRTTESHHARPLGSGNTSDLKLARMAKALEEQLKLQDVESLSFEEHFGCYLTRR